MRRAKAFTLIELLVVIAIIAILIAILLPVCIKIRRRALALVSPIAYVGEDGGVYLTDAKGGHSLQISEPATHVQGQHAVWGPISWSPSGQCVAWNGSSSLAPALSSLFYEPSSGRYWNCPLTLFSGWIDSETILTSDGGVYRIRGDPKGWQPIDSAKIPIGPLFYGTLSPAPVGADFPYLAGFQGGVMPQIRYVRKNYEAGRIIIESPDLPHQAYLFPKIDPLNEYVAWSAWPLTTTAVKSLREAPSIHPMEVQGMFCDWTEDDNLLTLSGGTLAVYTKDGKLLRKLRPPVKPMHSYMAAYRKYGHH